MIVFRILGFDFICYAKGYFEFGLRSCMHLSTATSGHQQKYIQLLKLCAFSFVAACAFEKLWLLPFHARFLKQIKKSALLPSCQACSGSSFIAVFLHSFIIISFLFNPPTTIPLLHAKPLSPIFASAWISFHHLLCHLFEVARDRGPRISLICRTGVLILTCLTIVIAQNAHLIN